jgi:mannose-6-phosphate isomerase-like protein (cupin superfamily)
MWWLLLVVMLVTLLLWFLRPGPRFRTSSLNVWRGAVQEFSLADFRQHCGEELLRVENYTGKLDPDGTVVYHPLRNWFDELRAQRGKLSKLAFDPTTDKLIGRYLLQWWATQIPSLPVAVQQRLRDGNGVRHCVRLSNGNWHFPNHFDCVDNFAVVLAGTRKVILDQRGPPLVLHAGDILYIPAGQEHEFWCDTAADELNILFTVNLNPHDVDGTKRCNALFAQRYPQQQQRLDTNFEYT